MASGYCRGLESSQSHCGRDSSADLLNPHVPPSAVSRPLSTGSGWPGTGLVPSSQPRPNVPYGIKRGWRRVDKNSVSGAVAYPRLTYGKKKQLKRDFFSCIKKFNCAKVGSSPLLSLPGGCSPQRLQERIGKTARVRWRTLPSHTLWQLPPPRNRVRPASGARARWELSSSVRRGWGEDVGRTSDDRTGLLPWGQGVGTRHLNSISSPGPALTGDRHVGAYGALGTGRGQADKGVLAPG